jgi:hypothetical protein
MTYARLMLERLQVRLNNFANPFLETIQPCKTKDIIIGILLFLAVFSILAYLCTEALINGDAAVYIQQMQNLDFVNRSVHIGYYLLGAAVLHILPGSDDYVINLMNCSLGALSIMLVYFITFTICHKHIPAIVASLLLFTNYIFIENSIYAEVYAPQVCFFLLSIFLWLLNKPVFAALSFLLSFLITPSAIFALPCFFILRPRLRPLLLFCVIFLVSAVVAIFPVRQSYFFGSRGLFEAANRPLNLSWALFKEGREIFSGFFLCIPLVAAGLLEIFGRKQFRPFAFALLVLWLVTFFSAEKINDVPPQLPVYAMLCVVGGLGFGLIPRISDSKTYIKFISYAVVIAVIFAVFINGFVAFKKLITASGCHTEYRNTVIEMGKVVAPDYVVVGGWTNCVLLEHYLSQKSYVPYCWINDQDLLGTSGQLRQKEAFKELRKAVAARRQIWLSKEHAVFFSVLQRNGYEITPFRDMYVATAGN